MDKYENSVMVALLPIVTDWCKIEPPHLTLVYVGEKEDQTATGFNELAKDVSSLAVLSHPVTLKVIGVETFGEEDRVDALRFRPSSELLAMRQTLESWNVSKHPFNPHATIGPVGTFIQSVPDYVAFDRIAVCWGTDMLTFWLRR